MASNRLCNALVVFGCLACLFSTNYLISALQFPWADNNPAVTESSLSVFDLRRPEFPAERVQEFLNESIAGKDYPNFSTIPVTNFTCKQVEQPGYYADPDTGCQVYRRCDPSGQMFSYLCGEQTIFDQLLLTCDFFYKVNCNISQAYYNYVNMHLYKSGEMAGH